MKLFDYFEVCKIYFGSSCSLNRLLEINGEEVKTSSGMQAVIWAKEEKWDELIDYCMADTILTHKISCREKVVIPLTRIGNVSCNHHMIKMEEQSTTLKHELSFRFTDY